MSGLVLRRASSAPVADAPGSADPFQIAFRPAVPVLQAVADMHGALKRFNQERDQPFDMYDEERATKLLSIIPEETRLREAQELFREAEFEPAPEAWLHIAIGAMLASTPAAANVPDAYRCGIVDTLYHDPNFFDGYSPGVSCAVAVLTIRQARLGALPSPAAFIAMCRKHRTRFRKWRTDIDGLVDLRYAAQSCLGEIGPDDMNWIPF